MAVTEDEIFELAIEDIVKVADELLKDKDPKTKELVTQQINKLQKLIERKQNQAEAELRKEIEDDDNEIRSMRDRIDKLLAKGIEDPGDKAIDHVKAFQDLKDNEWTKVFGFFQETGDAVHVVHAKLLNILKRAFKMAGEKMRDSRAQIVYQVLEPGPDLQTTKERLHDMKVFEKNEAELLELSSQCQLKAMPFCIDSIKKNIRDAILDQDKQLCTVLKASDAFHEAMDNYLLKCIEFSWAAAFEEMSPIMLVTDPKQECPKKILSRFANLVDVPRQYTVEWPALVQGESIISPWVLSDSTQRRPTATPSKEDEQKNVKNPNMKNKDKMDF